MLAPAGLTGTAVQRSQCRICRRENCRIWTLDDHRVPGLRAGTIYDVFLRHVGSRRPKRTSTNTSITFLYMLRSLINPSTIQKAKLSTFQIPVLSQTPFIRLPTGLPEDMACERAHKRVRRSLPAVLMRAGTSKGLFIHRHDLPASEADWAGPLLAAMGSQGSDARQIDGVGGATSTTSKVAVISPSSRPGVDVDYTFVQVAVGQEVVDLSGNCGNMCSGVGPFALQEGLVRAIPGERTVSTPAK